MCMGVYKTKFLVADIRLVHSSPTYLQDDVVNMEVFNSPGEGSTPGGEAGLSTKVPRDGQLITFCFIAGYL